MIISLKISSLTWIISLNIISLGSILPLMTLLLYSLIDYVIPCLLDRICCESFEESTKKVEKQKCLDLLGCNEKPPRDPSEADLKRSGKFRSGAPQVAPGGFLERRSTNRSGKEPRSGAPVIAPACAPLTFSLYFYKYLFGNKILKLTLFLNFKHLKVMFDQNE